jgi:hypothetical protein
MHEICQSGSVGGAKPSLSLPLSALQDRARTAVRIGQNCRPSYDAPILETETYDDGNDRAREALSS